MADNIFRIDVGLTGANGSIDASQLGKDILAVCEKFKGKELLKITVDTAALEKSIKSTLAKMKDLKVSVKADFTNGKNLGGGGAGSKGKSPNKKEPVTLNNLVRRYENLATLKERVAKVENACGDPKEIEKLNAQVEELTRQYDNLIKRYNRANKTNKGGEIVKSTYAAQYFDATQDAKKALSNANIAKKALKVSTKATNEDRAAIEARKKAIQATVDLYRAQTAELKPVGDEDNVSAKRLAEATKLREQEKNAAIEAYREITGASKASAEAEINNSSEVYDARLKYDEASLKASITQRITANKLYVKYKEDYEKYLEIGADEKAPDAMKRLKAAIDEMGKDSFDPKNIKAASLEITSAIKDIEVSGGGLESFSHKVQRVFGQKLGYGLMAAFASKARQALREVYTNVVELDAKMTQLEIVTKSSSDTMKKYSNDIAKAAKKVGSSMADLTDSATVYARLGYGIDESTKLAEYTAMLKNVGDIDISTTQSAVTAIFKAFKDVDVSNAEAVMDKLVYVGNNFPISVSELAEGINNAGSALSASGNSFEQSLALLAAANTTVQNISKSSTGLRTVSARIRNMKTELDDMGETMTEAEYDKLVKSLTDNNVSIADMNGNLRSTYDILSDVAAVWNKMTSNEQASLAETLAGTRQQNVFYSIIEQFNEASNAMQGMQSSAGSLTEAYGTYAKSIQFHLDRIKASFEELSSRILGTEAVNVFMTLINVLISVVNGLDKATGGATSFGVATIALIAIIGTLIDILKTKKIFKSVAAGFGLITKTVNNLVNVIAGLFTDTASSIALTSGQLVIWIAAISAAVAIGKHLYDVYRSNHKTVEELTKEVESYTKQLEEATAKQNELKKKLDELNKAKAAGFTNDAQQEEIDNTNIQIELLEKEIQYYNALIEAKKAEIATENHKNATKFFTRHYSDNTGIEMSSGVFDVEKRINNYKEAERKYRKAIEEQDEETALYWQGQMTQLAQKLNDDKIELGDFIYDDTYGEQAKGLIEEVTNLIIESFGTDIPASINETNDSMKGLVESASNLYDTYDLVQSAEKEFSEGSGLSMSTLNSIVEKYPELAENVGLYIAGLKTTKELIGDLQNAYDADVNNFYESIRLKLEGSAEFYNSLPDGQKSLVKNLADGYGVDLGKFKTLGEAKLKFESTIIQKLAGMWKKYNGMTIKQLYAERNILGQKVSHTRGDSSRGADYLRAELSDLNSTIAEYESMQRVIDNIGKDGFSDYFSSKFTPKSVGGNSSSSGSSSEDKFKEAMDYRLKELKHNLEMQRISYEQYFDDLANIRNEYLYTDEPKYRDEIWSLEEEIFNGRLQILDDFIKDYNKVADRMIGAGNTMAAKENYEEILKEIEESIEWGLKNGFAENSDFMQDLRDRWKTAADQIVEVVSDSFSEFESYMDDFDLWTDVDFTKTDFYDNWLKELETAYKKGLILYSDYVKQYNEISKKRYDTMKNSFETIIDATIEMIEHEYDEYLDKLDDEVDAYRDLINVRKEALRQSQEELNHEEEVAELAKDIAKLQSKISQLSLDDSRSATAKRAELEEQLADKQKQLDKLQRDYQLQQTEEALDKSLEMAEENANNEKKLKEQEIDTWAKKYEMAIKMLDEDWNGTYSKLLDYTRLYTNSIDGEDSIVSAWKNATLAVEKYGSATAAIPMLNDENMIVGNNGSGVVLKDRDEAIHNILTEMKNNAASWSSSNDSTRDALVKRNDVIGSMLADYGIQAVRDANGVWHEGSVNGPLLFEKYKKYIYHKGGVAGDNGTLKDNEIMSILQKGELVLDNNRKVNLTNMITSLNALMSKLTSSNNGLGSSFNPQFNITIQHSGDMNDSEARRYGDIVAESALQKLKTAFERRGI